MIEKISKMRAYLDYIEEHYCTVQWAWDRLQAKCADMNFVLDAEMNQKISYAVKNHDASKLSASEFNPYREHFYPTLSEIAIQKSNSDIIKFKKSVFEEAWEHHKIFNDHHWQSWTARSTDKDLINCVHMMCDWIAMSHVQGGTALEWYTDNKPTIILPIWADNLVVEVFGRLYAE